MNDYESLKKLLLQDETEAIVKLEEKLAELLRDTQDHDLIIQRLTPVIGDLLKETISNSSDEIAKVMAPIMGDAIKEQVRTQKQTIEDALYPIMGNMIAKFVSSALKDTLDEINSKLQNNFSFSAIKRKITARIKGISESELLLQESSLGSIETVFLIHTQSGLLMWQGSKNHEDVIEADMVSSMLSAIRSFVNDWISQSNDTFELNTIDYGDSKIHLEVSGSCYLAVVVRGEVRAKMQTHITTVFSDVVQKHADSLNNFNGDTSSLDIEDISKRLEQLFEIKENSEDSQEIDAKTKWFTSTLFILILAGFSYMYYNSYMQEQKEKLIMDQFYHTPELNLYRIDADIEKDKVILRGVVPNERLKHLAESLVYKNNLALSVVNDIVLTQVMTTPESITSQALLLDDIYNSQKDINISSQFDNGTIILKGKVADSLKIAELIKSYSKINGVDNIINTIEITLKPIKERIYFATGQLDLNKLQKESLKNMIIKYGLVNLSKQADSIKLNIKAYTDGIGDPKANKEYAFKRAQNVKKYLLENAVEEKFMLIDSYANPPEDFNTSQGLQEARVVMFSWSTD
jgi:outer membrane protein OmpA-like peptidoglycan-associated protein